MRVTQSETYRNILSDIGNANETYNTISRQVSSGKKLTQLSDSPAASAEIVSLSDQALEIGQYRSNIDAGTFFLQTSESVLNEVNNLATSIYSSGSQAASNSVNADARAILAGEIRGLRDQIFALANTQARGRYIFAGSDVLSAPFSINCDTVAYQGNNEVNKIAVDEGMEVSAGVSGSAAFDSVFSVINSLLTALDAGDISGVQNALGQFSSALMDLGIVRGQIGSNLNLLENATTNLDTREINIQERRSTLEDTDMSKAVIQLSQSQNALQAALSSGGSILTQDNLFDILG
jgi:flagellar hook-associated protein 3 FlgL